MTADAFTNSVQRRVRDTLHRFLRSQRSELDIIAPELEACLETLEAFLDGGKYLRPEFLAAGAAAADGPLDGQVMEGIAKLGGAVELVQAAALIHDDVIDHSPLRRGRPAVHIAAELRHRTEQLQGSPSDFGAATAVITGDLALALAYELAHEGSSGADDARHFRKLCSEVMAGQFLDITHQAGALHSPASQADAARAVIRWKTVPYTVLRPLLIGAAHVGASSELMGALERLAIPVGTAFQLCDDILGVFGNEDAMGKSATSDITEGKKTLLLAYATDAASEDQRRALEATVGRPDASEDDIAKVKDVMRDTGALDRCIAEIEALGHESHELLEDEVMPLAHATARPIFDSLITRATSARRVA